MKTGFGNATIVASGFIFSLIGSHPAQADTATIDLECGIGRLDLTLAGGELIASGGRATFTGATFVLLSDGEGGPETSGGTVTVHMTDFTPSVVSGSLEIRLTDGEKFVRALVLDSDGDFAPDVLLSNGETGASVEFLAPNAANNFMTLTYNPATEAATVTIEGFLGDTATLNDTALGPVQMGVFAYSNLASFGAITFTGTDIPLFPPLVDPMNLWVDFAETCGNGAQGYPFGLLADAVAEADPGALVSIWPGTNSGETFAGGSAINSALTIANADSGSGPVSIGVTARRGLGTGQSKTGFVSRQH